MGEFKKDMKSFIYLPEKLIIGIISPFTVISGIISSCLITEWGEIDDVFGPYPFGYTRYYSDEMGDNLSKFFISFKDLVRPDMLSVMKTRTNEIEEKFSINGKRIYNLDPGLLSADRIILATTKNRGHRIPIGLGIFAEITLLYSNGEYRSLPWTYADFCASVYYPFFITVRKKYLQQLRELN